MARIRTIKPEFFTSEDIVSLSPMARLLYIALWCEADRSGRFVWKPKTFKLRYFPGDSIDIETLCAEVLAAKLVVQYGDGLAHIPKFSTHQHVNPREAASALPDPDACARVVTRDFTVIDAQVGREGEGREGKEKELTSAEAPSADPCPHQAIVALYHEVLPQLTQVRSWEEDRRALLRSRWREDPARQNLGWWREFFEYVGRCPFLLGQEASGGRDPFLADLEWLVRPKNFRKVVEGKYEPRRSAA